MTSLQLPSAVFPENAIKRAERAYQTRSARKLRPWRRWISRAVMWLAITIALIQFGGLLVGSLTLRDPRPIVEALNPLPNLLMLFAFTYHFYLMFQTIALTGNSITREKRSQTWDLLVLTGIDARQIVRGKWWATIQHQYPRYLRLALLRLGATSAFAISVAGASYYFSNYYNARMQLPHPLTVLIASFYGILFTMVNLAFSAACGVMGSAVSKRSTIAMLRGFILQIVIPIIPAIVLVILLNRTLYISTSSPIRSIAQSVVVGSASVVDNGFNLVAYPMSVDFQFYNLEGYTPLAPIQVDWMISGLLTLGLYILFIWFALWRAEKRAVGALATPFH